MWEAYGTQTRTALSKIAAAAAEFQRVTHDAFLRTLRSRVCGALLLGVARALNHYKTLPIMELWLSTHRPLTLSRLPFLSSLRQPHRCFLRLPLTLRLWLTLRLSRRLAPPSTR